MSVCQGCALILLVGLTACGKKGPPLAPLYLIPSPVSDISARRADDAVRLRFALPAKNVNGPGIDLDRVQIYAITAGPGAAVPANRDLLTKTYLVGEIEVKPPPVEGAAEAKEDKRPSPGDTVTFVERLTPAVLQPAPLPLAPVAPAALPPAVPMTTLPGTAMPAPAWPGEPAPPAAAEAAKPPAPAAPVAAPAPPAPPNYTMRIYILRGVARSGHAGPPSTRVAVPLGDLPDAPGGVSAKHTEKAVVLEWLPAVAAVGATTISYNVYRADSTETPLNAKPLASATYEQNDVPLGDEICFRVRSVTATGPVEIESPLSSPACVTPADVFPPAPPKGLAPVATPGAVNLIWDANSEADLAGYLVLRAEAPDETLQTLTPAPIRDTFYRDTSVKPGVQYVYAIVAVDSAAKPNRSEPSARAEVIAR